MQNQQQQQQGIFSPTEKNYIQFDGGMRRREIKPRFELIDSDWLRGVAKVLTEGAIKYGDLNWQKANTTAKIDSLNHVIDHLFRLKDGDTTEDHVYHASCGLMFLAKYLRDTPDLFTKPASDGSNG